MKNPFSDVRLINQPIFLVADTQLYMWLCPSVGPLVRLLVLGDQVEKWKNERFKYFLCIFVCGEGFRV